MIRYIDIAANLTDPMFKEGSSHPLDLEHVLKRAVGAGVKGILVTAGSLHDSAEVCNRYLHVELV